MQLTDYYEDYEQSFLNCVLGNILYNLRSVKNEDSKNIVLTCIKNYGEDEDGFLNHPLDYYYNFNKILEYCLINGELPIVLERIKEHHKRAQSISLQKDRKIQKLENELNKIRQSKSFIIGEKLAWPVRKLRRVLRPK